MTSQQLRVRMFGGKADRDAVARIEEEAFFPHDWTREDYGAAMAARNTLATVAVAGDGEVVGVCVQQIAPEHVSVLRLAAKAGYHQKQAMNSLVANLQCKIAASKKKTALASVEHWHPEVSETLAERGFTLVGHDVRLDGRGEAAVITQVNHYSWRKSE